LRQHIHALLCDHARPKIRADHATERAGSGGRSARSAS
jgi:hypothetical protein